MRNVGDARRAMDRAEALAAHAAAAITRAASVLPPLEQDLLDVLVADLTANRRAARCYPPAVRTSMVVSRFYRAGLPSPAWIRRMARLAIVAELRQSGCSVTAVAYALDYSSVNALCRTVRHVTGVPASRFRDRFEERLADITWAIAHPTPRPDRLRQPRPDRHTPTALPRAA